MLFYYLNWLLLGFIWLVNKFMHNLNEKKSMKGLDVSFFLCRIYVKNQQIQLTFPKIYWHITCIITYWLFSLYFIGLEFIT
jgi:hypothetical protein